MAYTTGEATNHLNLLEILRGFLTTNAALVAAGQAWTQIGGETGTIDSGDFVSLRGPGLGGSDQILLSLDAYSNEAAAHYSLRLRGHTAYNQADPSISPPGLNSPLVYYPLINGTIRYWIVANGRRFIMVAKSNNRYDVMYGGLALPRHLPSDWPYPLLIGGSATSYIQNSSDSSSHTNPWRGVNGSAYLFSPEQLWRPFVNITASSNNNDGSENSPTSGDLMCVEWKNNIGPTPFTRTLDGQPWLRRGSIAQFGTSTLNARNFLGYFDGIYYTPSVGAVIESIIEYDNKDYLVVPNIYRNSEGQVAAVLLE